MSVMEAGCLVRQAGLLTAGSGRPDISPDAEDLKPCTQADGGQDGPQRGVGGRQRQGGKGSQASQTIGGNGICQEILLQLRKGREDVPAMLPRLAVLRRGGTARIFSSRLL